MQRQCDILGIPEEHVLIQGLDFRLPQFRREVFLRFYEFHTKYGSHPGAVYYAFPYLFNKFNMATEEKLWFCFINGVCQNVVTTYEIWSRFPDFKNLDMDSLSFFFRQNYPKFGWDTDRRYTKNQFERCIKCYQDLVGRGTQEQYFGELCNRKDKYFNFEVMWHAIMRDFHLFGRLSTFSYLEYLRIAGVNVECNSLFLEDINGSKSHRNGLCKVLGRDDLDWHDKLNPDFDGKYSDELISWLEKEGELLLEEAAQRFPGTTYFTLESTLCCYKSWHRVNRRYPNVYNDMFFQRILNNEAAWGKRNELFRTLRRECLPIHLRIEDQPGDPGLKPEKQNHYLNTGQVIMMDREWPCFHNDFNDNLKYKPKNPETSNLTLWK